MNILFISQLYPLSKEDSKNSFALHYFIKEWLKEHNVQVIRPYLSYEKGEPPKNKIVNIDNVKVHLVKPIWIPIIKTSFVNKSKTIDLITPKPDIIICHLYHSYVTFNFLKKHFNVPFVAGIHRTDALLAQNILYRNKIKKGLKHADVIAYRSMAIKNIFEKTIKMSAEKSFIANSGIPEILIENAKRLLENTKKQNRTIIKIISVCRLLKLKQIDKVIIALSKLKKEGIKWKYTIIGEGPEKQRLKKLTAHYQLEKQITFYGQMPREKVFEHLGNNDIFVMPSYNETFGLVFLEAMANGCIVIGAKMWGIDGIVKNEENGFLCDPHNQEKIYVCLKKVLSMQNQKINEIRLNSLNTVLNFSDKKMANDYLQAVNFK